MRFPGFEGEWVEKRLGDYIDVISGIPLQSEEISEDTSGVAILRGINITEGLIRHNKEIDRYYTKVITTKINKYLLEEKDLVIGMDGSKVGKNVALISNSDSGSILIQRVARIKALENLADINYIFQRIFSKEFQKYVDVVNTSSGIPHISLQQIKDFEIGFPPKLSEQEKIASFLTLIDERIATQNKIIEHLESLIKGLRGKLFSQQLRFNDNDGNYFAEWQEKMLGEVCDIIGGGTPETNKSEYWNGKIQWFTPTEIKTNFVRKSERTITELGLKNSSAKILPKGAILLTTRATIGEVAIALEECTTNQGFQSLIVKKDHNNIFIYNWIKNNKNELIKRSNGSTFSEISKSEIESIEILLPPFSEQTLISNFLSSINEKIEIENRILFQYEKQKKQLLHNLFI